MKLRSCWAAVELALVLLVVIAIAPLARAQEPAATGRSFEPTAVEIARHRAEALSRFLSGDTDGALDALNRVGEPTVSDVKLEGLVRTNRTLLADYLGIEAGDLLTAGRLLRVSRRLHDFPVASSGKARYDLTEAAAIVRPIMFERSRFYAAPLDWAPVGARAIFTQELSVTLSDAFGQGETITPSVRWASGRPRVMLRYDAPAPGLLPGVVHLNTTWERHHYRQGSTDVNIPTIDENRFRVGASLSDWLTGWLLWEGGAAMDRIGPSTYGVLDGSLSVRSFGDHVATGVAGALHGSRDAGNAKSGEATVAFRSTTYDDQPNLTGLAGFAMASNSAPLLLWPSASTGTSETAQLRAHRLYQSGVVTGDVFGRKLTFGSVEYMHPLPTRLGPAFVGVAGFVDAAQARSRLMTGSSPVMVDVGVGLRVNSSRAGNQVRLDVGYGLRDGRTRISAGYIQPWGRR